MSRPVLISCFSSISSNFTFIFDSRTDILSLTSCTLRSTAAKPFSNVEHLSEKFWSIAFSCLSKLLNYDSRLIKRVEFCSIGTNTLSSFDVNWSFLATTSKFYPNIHLSLRPVPHDPSLPVPLDPKDALASLADEMVLDEDCNLALSDSTGSEYELGKKLKPILFSQEQLNDLIRDLALSKQKAELFASRLQENNLLQKDELVSHF